MLLNELFTADEKNELRKHTGTVADRKTYSGWTPEKIGKSILGNHFIFEPDIEWWEAMDKDPEISAGMYIMTTSHTGMPMFTDFDVGEGNGGVIGLLNHNQLYGTDTRSIATAIHETIHAMLHLRNRKYTDEKEVNRLSAIWARKNLEGVFLHQVLEVLLNSNLSYGHTGHLNKPQQLTKIAKKMRGKL